MEDLAKELKIQGELVRDLKANADTPKADLDAAVEKLKQLKAQLKEFTDQAEAARKEKAAFRAGLEDLLLRKFFYVPSFEIYGGVGGLYDYGPPGCAVMSNLQQYWRQHFVLTESMLEVSCSSMTPEAVLKASGHVDRFTDYMVQDTVTKDFYRADKLLEEHLEKLLAQDTKVDAAYTQQLNADLVKAGSMTRDELQTALTKYGVKTGENAISEVSVFNLMFKTSIGPTGKFVGYLRPETAQGIFVNFRRLYEYNNRRLPFAAAQIGLAYRNEIAPRAGLLRVREFPLAEIEHFVNPEKKDHVRFHEVKDYQLDLLPKDRQDGVSGTIRMTAAEAVAKGVINNETLAYFMCRTHKFLVNCGVDVNRLRFRQHLDTEMAHYAKDCWDAEIHTTYGWIECVGHADRSAFDLSVHSQHAKVDLSANEPLETPVVVEKLVAKPNLGSLGRTLRKAAPELVAQLNEMSQEALAALQQKLESTGKAEFTLSTGPVEVAAADLKVQMVSEKVSSVSYLPSVIEPSFGLGRIIYSVLEHAYYVRPEDEQRKVLRLTPIMAPVKVALYNVVGNIAYQPVFAQLRAEAIDAGLTYIEDDSKNTIGRKYSRGDEIGIPFAISVDQDSCDPAKKLVTIRERDSCKQIQVSISEAIGIIGKMCKLQTTWEEVYEKYPKFVYNEQPEN